MAWLAAGIAGLALISAGWALSLPSKAPLRLSVLYLAGSGLLTAYAAVNHDPVFTALNAAATLLAALNVAATLRGRGLVVEVRGRGCGARVVVEVPCSESRCLDDAEAALREAAAKLGRLKPSRDAGGGGQA